MTRVDGVWRRCRERVQRWRHDVRAISGIGAVGLSGAGLALTIAVLAVTQADLLSQRAEPVATQALDDITVDLRVGEIMGRVDRQAVDPAVSEMILSASVGFGTDRFDMRDLTMRYTNGDQQLIVAHEDTNATGHDGTFSVRVVRDMDGSMRDGRVGQGDRIDIVIDLAALDATMVPTDRVTIYFHTEGGTALRLQVDAPRTLGQDEWVRMEGDLLRGA